MTLNILYVYICEAWIRFLTLDVSLEFQSLYIQCLLCCLNSDI